MKKPTRLILIMGTLFLTGLIFFTVSAGSPGDFDTSFSGDGFDAVRTGNLSHEGGAIALQSDGKIVVAGDQQNNLVVLRYKPNGALDNTFGGGDGIVVTNISGDDEEVTDVVVQPDGKIIVIGTADENDLIMARYLPDGTLDTTFAENGKYASTILPGGFVLSGGITLLPSGKFVVSGSFFDSTDNDYDFLLARFKANGKIDKTFGDGDGVAFTDFEFNWDFGSDVVRQSDGKLIIVGSGDNGALDGVGVARYNANGTPDNTFGGGDGKIVYPFASYAARAEILPEDKILIAGGASGDLLLMQILTNGDPDPAFGGGDGIVTHPLDLNSVGANDLARLPDGKILAVGSGYNGSEYEMVIARFSSTGSLDTSFSGDGKVLLREGGTYNNARGVVIQPDGKILLTGQMDIEEETYIYTARLHNETLRNADFEEDKNGNGVPDYWKAQNLSNDSVVCNSPGTPSFSGDCTFRMRGDADGQRERLIQDFHVSGIGGDEFTFSAYLETNNIPADSAKLYIEYWSGNALINKSSIPVTTLNSDGYFLLSHSLTALGIYDRVRVSIDLQAASGRLLADSLNLTQTGEVKLEITVPNSPDLRMSN